MMLRLLGREFQGEDILLLLWVAILEPLLDKLLFPYLGNLTLGNLSPALPGSVGLGLFFAVATLCLCVCLATRTPGDTENPITAGEEDARLTPTSYARLPLVAVLILLLSASLSLLGIGPPEAAIPGGFLFSLVTLVAFPHLPELKSVYRRILVAPTITLGSWLFTSTLGGFVGDTFKAPSLWAGYQYAAANGQLGLLAFVMGLVLAGAAVFYVMFILAPRYVAGGEGSWGDWVWRFVVYLLGVLIGLELLDGLT